MTLKNILRNPNFWKRAKMKLATKLKLYDKMPDEKFLKIRYKVLFGKELNLNNPKTFNEKLQWLKLYNRNPIYTTMVDKYAAKEFVAEKIGGEYIIPTLGVWDKFEDIDFDKLPMQFVLKCTHDSGGLVICRDKSKLDFKKAKKKIEKSLKRDFYLTGREWPYKNVKRRIIAEKYIENKNGALVDYKFMCFDGKAECIFVCSERFGEDGVKITAMDSNWNIMPFKRPNHSTHKKELTKPVNFDKMLELAAQLSHGHPFLRVDFYEVDEKVFFSELTFYPASGFGGFEPWEWDEKLGDMLKLPDAL